MLLDKIIKVLNIKGLRHHFENIFYIGIRKFEFIFGKDSVIKFVGGGGGAKFLNINTIVLVEQQVHE